MDEDVPILKQKKRKVAIDPDQDEEENVAAVVTKRQEEDMERESYAHKTNGDKKPEIKKQSEKNEESKPKKEENKAAAPAKPKPTAEKSNTQKESEKAKPNSASSEKKPSTTNGQPAKKAVEEKKAAPKPTKRKEESDDEDDDEDEESEEESDSESDRPKKSKKKTPTKKEPIKKEPAKTGNRDELIYNVLKRWWYCMPEWPPADYDYSAELQKRNLRKIDFKYWRIERDVDEKGFKKVYEIPSYPGVFKNAQGENIDLRPRESCPCYDVMKKKSMEELLELLTKALKNQTEALEKSGNNDEELMKDLQRELKRAEASKKAFAARKK